MHAAPGAGLVQEHSLSEHCAGSSGAALPRGPRARLLGFCWVCQSGLVPARSESTGPPALTRTPQSRHRKQGRKAATSTATSRGLRGGGREKRPLSGGGGNELSGQGRRGCQRPGVPSCVHGH